MKLKKIVGALALAAVVALSGAGVQQVYAAEDVVVATDTDAATDVDTTMDTDTTADADTTTDTDTTADATTDADTATDVDATTDADTVTDTDAATDAATVTDVDATTDTDVVTDISVYADDSTTVKKDAAMYTTRNDDNYRDSKELENVVDISGEDGDILETIFKLNFEGALTCKGVFKHNDDLTDLCTDLPEGLRLYKYTYNNGADYMRVKMMGTAVTVKYNVTITIPADKLVARIGYQIPESGLSVTIYLTVNGKKIPVEVPVQPATDGGAHEHHYEWTTIKTVTDTEDGIEAYMCSCGDVEQTRTVSAYGAWLKAVEKKILTAEQNATVEVKTDVWNTYNKNVINALQKRDDVTLVTTFGRGDDAVSFVIPAGAGTTIVEEATALAASVDDATGATTSVAEEPQWYGFGYLTGVYAQ